MYLFSNVRLALPSLALLIYFFIQYASIVSTLQVYVGAAEVSKTQATDTCGDIQEFACKNPDTCDKCAGPANGGRCRNNGQDCAAGDYCPNVPGHCIENTFCEPGRHSMPVNGQPKHFKCLSVTGLQPQEVIVIYRNNDYTGDACVVNADGAWAAPGDQLSNSVDTTPSGGQFPACRKAGQAAAAQTIIPVGAAVNAGTSATGGTCPISGDAGSATCTQNADVFPVTNHTYWHSNADVNAKRLRRRGDDFRLPNSDSRTIAANTGILLVALQLINGAFRGVLQRVNQDNAQTDQEFLGGHLAGAWDGDHIMELQLMTAWFATNPNNGQWQFIWDEMQNCPTDYNLVTQAVNNCNLIGVAKRVNGLKGQLFGVAPSGNNINVNWARFLRVEVEALHQYMNDIHGRFLEILNRVGAIMDNIWHAHGGPGGANTPPPSATFASYAQQRWQDVLNRIQQALANPAGFRPESDLNVLYDQSQLP